MFTDMSGWDWVWMPTMMVFWAVVVLLIVLIAARGFGHEPRVDSAETPQGILARRFANGEIDQDEYRSAVSLLSSQGGASGLSKAPGNS